MRRPPLLAAGLVLGLIAVVTAEGAPASAGEGDEGCLTCHEDATLEKTLPNGDAVRLGVDAKVLAGSVHAGIGCADCHAGYDDFPHPERTAESKAEFRAGFRDICKTCHLDKFEQDADGVHHKMLAAGNTSAPTCIDCHGAHDVTPPATPRAKVSETCAGCHYDVFETYSQSVHGKALLEGGNEDAPVCTDCHRSHDIPDPTNEAWLLRIHEECGKCHADEKKMAKYGLSTAVLQTYLEDFHGTTATLTGGNGRKGEAPRVTALCIDCHGVHDIAKVDDPSSPVLKANLVKTCRKCHPGATENFPAAWLSHYEPTWDKAPLVYAVKVFYWIFIPFIIGGLCLQIVLHLWRVVVNR